MAGRYHGAVNDTFAQNVGPNGSREAPELQFTRGAVELWGHCAGCEFAEVCRGGCNFTAHAFFGRPGNNPYCHHRALQLRRRGLRERLVPQEPAPGTPFDHGRFALVEEPFDAPEPALVPLRRLNRRATPAARPR